MAPEVALYFPAGQGTAIDAFTQNDPEGQGEEEQEPAAQNCPKEQSTQSAKDVDPGPLYFPAGHVIAGFPS